jgi:hypothetical protein
MFSQTRPEKLAGHEQLGAVEVYAQDVTTSGLSKDLAGGSTLWLFNIAMENCPLIDDFPS